MGSRPVPPPRPQGPPRAGVSDRWFKVKQQLHSRLISTLTPDQLRTINKEGIRDTIANVLERIVREQKIPMTLNERETADRGRFSTRCSALGRWSRC
jgi:hypothetical protein